MTEDYAELMQEIFDLREETMHLKAQIKNDDEYLEVLTRAEGVNEDWKRRIQVRRNYTHQDYPELI